MPLTLSAQVRLTHSLRAGSDSFSSLAFAGFHALHALAADACSPFNHSNGITLGEGAGMTYRRELRARKGTRR